MTAKSVIKTISKESPSDQVFSQLKMLIDTRVWEPGFRIPSETQLAEQFGVSRMTVRSATQRLKTMGLLDVQQGNGSFVSQPTLETYMKASGSGEIMPSALADAYSLRFYLEQAAVELAIQNASEEDINKLEMILNNLKSSTESHPEDFLDYDIAFHRFIYVMSGNRLLLTIYNMTEELLRKQISNFDDHIPSDENLQERRREFHQYLFDCIKNRDLDTAIEHLKWYREVGIVNM